MAATLAVFAAVQVAWPIWIRPHLIAPVHTVVALDPGNIFEIKSHQQQHDHFCDAELRTAGRLGAVQPDRRPVRPPPRHPHPGLPRQQLPRVPGLDRRCTSGSSSPTSPPAASGTSSGPRPRSSLSLPSRWPGPAPGGSAAPRHLTGPPPGPRTGHEQSANIPPRPHITARHPMTARPDYERRVGDMALHMHSRCPTSSLCAAGRSMRS